MQQLEDAKGKTHKKKAAGKNVVAHDYEGSEVGSDAEDFEMPSGIEPQQQMKKKSNKSRKYCELLSVNLVEHTPTPTPTRRLTLPHITPPARTARIRGQAHGWLHDHPPKGQRVEILLSQLTSDPCVVAPHVWLPDHRANTRESIDPTAEAVVDTLSGFGGMDIDEPSKKMKKSRKKFNSEKKLSVVEAHVIGAMTHDFAFRPSLVPSAKPIETSHGNISQHPPMHTAQFCGAFAAQPFSVECSVSSPGIAWFMLPYDLAL
ncbi:hypothetical protein JB92DRAFT_2826221 [Gautieria morchelliformis]|nr:hypothetical protein JB92DRAFT_2826221 [Gautieria morchelliformis]